MNATRLSHESKSIIITKAFSQKANDPNQKEYRELMELKRVYRDYSIIVRSVPKRRVGMQKITLEKMRAYISKHDTDGSIMTAFEGVVKESKQSLEYSGFFGVKKWFFEQYPDLVA